MGRFESGALKMDSRTFRVAVAAMAIGWLPPCLLTAMQSLTTGDASLHSFLTDYGVLARSLVAAPLLILGQAVAGPLLGAIVRHFREAGLVQHGGCQQILRHRPFHAPLARLHDRRNHHRHCRLCACRRLLDRAGAAFARLASRGSRASRPPPAGGTSSSACPSSCLLLLGWLWRLGLWTRFLWKVSRLDLLLIPSHPDGAAGLKFLGMSLEALVLPAFAISCVIAGPLANRVVHGGAQIMTFRAPVLAFAVLLLALLAGPLLLFTGRLVSAMHRGMLDYGAMARGLGEQLESRWLGKPVEQKALDAPDFSATTDLYSIVSNVYTMNIMPLSLRNLADDRDGHASALPAGGASCDVAACAAQEARRVHSLIAGMRRSSRVSQVAAQH